MARSEQRRVNVAGFPAIFQVHLVLDTAPSAITVAVNDRYTCRAQRVRSERNSNGSNGARDFGVRARMTRDAATTAATTARVEADLRKYGYSIVRQLLPETAINRARAHLEKCVDKHLAAEVEAGRLSDACAGLPLEERMARAYAHDPEAAPCSWVPQTKHAFAFNSCDRSTLAPW